MQGARSAETGMYRVYMRISSTAQRPAGSTLRGASPPGDGVRRRHPSQQFLRQLLAQHFNLYAYPVVFLFHQPGKPYVVRSPVHSQVELAARLVFDGRQ